MKMRWKKMSRMASLSLAGISVAVMLFAGGCASETAQQSPNPRPASGSGAAPASPAGGGGGGGAPAD